MFDKRSNKLQQYNNCFPFSGENFSPTTASNMEHKQKIGIFISQ